MSPQFSVRSEPYCVRSRCKILNLCGTRKSQPRILWLSVVGDKTGEGDVLCNSSCTKGSLAGIGPQGTSANVIRSSRAIRIRIWLFNLSGSSKHSPSEQVRISKAPSKA